MMVVVVVVAGGNLSTKQPLQGTVGAGEGSVGGVVCNKHGVG